MIRELCAGKHLKLLADGHWEFAERTRATGGVVILAFTERDELLLVEQFRPPVGKRVISLPAGLTGDGDSAEEAAVSASRELEEETGLVVRVGELIEVFERIIPDQHGRTQYHFVIIDHLCERVSGSPRPGGDAREAVWVEQGDLGRYALVPAVIRVLGKAFELARLRDSRPR